MGQNTGHSNGQGIPYEEYELLDVPLGDLLRGERATLGKSLLDVERDLKIRATYIAAIENADLDAFASRGFIAGYVRSYARYLGLDPEWTYARFSRESGFHGAHGISAKQAEAAKRRFAEAPGRVDPNDVITAARVSFAPERERLFDRIEPGALGSILVLVAVVLGIGYGAWAILHDIQRLQFAPVDEAPTTFADLDPVAGAGGFDAPGLADTPGAVGGTDQRIDRLYRPQALDTPVMTPRDQPLATLDPERVGTLATPAPPEIAASTEPAPLPGADVQVTAQTQDEVVFFAASPSWVRVQTASGALLFEGTLNSGDSYTLPRTAEAPVLRTGNAGGIFFLVNDVPMGPIGAFGGIVDNIELSAEAITRDFTMADPTAEPEMVRYVQLILAGEATELNPEAGQ
ncbi:MAG: RodZ domain-containing protein [Pseudomonadota bacterium]